MSGSPHILAIGRSDALGLEGLQGDQRAVENLGMRCCVVVTSLSSTDSGAPRDEIELSPSFIESQFDMIAACRDIAAVKVGRLLSEEQVEVVARLVEQLPRRPALVLAPALFRANGDRVMTVRALAHWKRRLPHLATLLVASAQEAVTLGGFEVGTRDEMRAAAELLMTLGSEAVLLSGALPIDGVGVDFLLDGGDDLVEREFALPRSAAGLVGNALGEGGLGRSMLAAGIAAQLAKGQSIRAACQRARDHAVTALERQRETTGAVAK